MVMDDKERGSLSRSPVSMFHWAGRTDRKTYSLVGVLLVAVKYLLDRWVAALSGRSWSGINYIVPNETFSLRTLPSEERGFYLTLAAIALPFILVGVLLTIRRLRDAGFPLWLSLLFFVPVVNLFFFAVLSLVPSRSPDTEATIEAARLKVAETSSAESSPLDAQPDLPNAPSGNLLYRILMRILPKNPWGSAFVTCLLLAVTGVLLTFFGVNILGNYGWGLFVGAPFCLGLVAAMLHGIPARRTLSQSVLVGLMALLMVCAALFIAAMEGSICIAMGIVIGLPITCFGSMVGYFIQDLYPRSDADGANSTTRITCALLVLLPLFMSVEKAFTPSPELIAVRTSVVVNAPPERVWPNVIAFPTLPAVKASDPAQWLFLTGIAYPKGARIEGQGVGAIRYCEFSTGPFVEPITIWDSPTLLAFDVIKQPATMRELSPYPDIHPPHLDNFLVSRRGQFRLTRLPNGRTHLEGTTFYQNRMWPAQYWRLWSDHIIHQIHARVLNHVKTQSEGNGQDEGVAYP
jgi:uncharacterized membrane protein YhaH (DUF805 family)